MVALALAHGATLAIFAQAAVFYGLVLRMRLAIGRWPRPYPPIAHEPTFVVHTIIAGLGAAGVVLSPALAVVLLAAARALGLSRGQLRVAAVAFGVTYLGALAVFHVDPGRFGEWFLD